MIMDKLLQMSDSQAVTTTAASTDYIDQKAAGNAEKALFLVIMVRETVTAAGAATVNFSLETDDNSSFSSPTVLFQTGDIGKAALVANSEVCKVRIPFGAERYLQTKFTVGTGPLTAGKFDAFLVVDAQTNK
jgi:hypothetical protein